MIYTMEKTKLAKLLEDEMAKKKISARKLGIISGVSRQTIGAILSGKRGYNPSTKIVGKLANALQISPKLLLEAIGIEYIEPISEKSKLLSLAKYPIYREFPFHAGTQVARPIDYIYRDVSGKAPKNIEGYPVIGTCLEPDIREGDIIVVDRDADINTGDIVACRLKGEIEDSLHIGKLRRIDNELWIENNSGRYPFRDCIVAAPVVEISRRLK